MNYCILCVIHFNCLMGLVGSLGYHYNMVEVAMDTTSASDC